MNYWSKKEELKKKAVEHTKKMEAMYGYEISECVKNTTEYGIRYGNIPKDLKKKENPEGEIYLSDESSVDAAFRHAEGKTAILNFASYKNPGGMFINGSSAQEESLCHASFLYNVLSQKKDFYAQNQKRLNRSLYQNHLLYSKDIRFFKNALDAGKLFDVITCAAPNRSAAVKYCNVPEDEIEREVRSRIRFLLTVAAKENVDTLILGAFGCGVFGNDAGKVARIFQETLNEDIFRGMFKKVVYAVLDSKSDNYKAFFKEVF